MNLRPWHRGGEASQAVALIRARVALRFSVTAERLAERVTALAAAAGASVTDHARRLALEDLYLATACAAGDEDAWTECARLHFAFIRSFARRFLSDAGARDLADQVIADLWQRGKIGSYAGRSSLRTWIGTVVTHAALNAKSAPHPVVALDPAELHQNARRQEAPSPGPEQTDATRILSDLVSRAVAALPAEDKLLLQLHYEEGLTLEQMEVAVRASKATLSRRLKRTREHLKRALDELAAGTYGTSAETIRASLSLDRVELDLSRLLAPVKGAGRDGV